MALNLQNDQGTVADANAYISVAFFKEYHDTRGNSYSGFNDAAIETGIVRATDYLDHRFRYQGIKRMGRDQATEWPRTNVWDRDRYYVTDIPREVKEACAEYALRALSAVLAPDPTYDATGAVIQSKSEQVGPISESVTYVSGASFQMPRYPAADQKLIKAGFTQTSGEVRRG